MDEDRVVERLRDLGLTAYQSRGYVAAVRLGTARPNDVAEAAGVPQARIYDVIDDLDEMGFLEIRERSGAKEVSAPPPGEILDTHRQQHIAEYTDTVDTIIDGLDQMYGGETSDEGFVSMVTMRKSARRHLSRIVGEADYWLSLVLSPSFYTDLQSEIEAATDDGVTARLVVTGETADLTFPDRLCVRTRQTSETVALADRAYGLYSNPHPRASTTRYLVARESSLVETFQGYFESLRRGAPTVQLSHDLPRRYPDPWRAILDLQERLEGSETLHVTVTGKGLESGRDQTWQGTLVDYELTGLVEADYSVVRPETATLTVDTGDERLTVGDHRTRSGVGVDVAAAGLEVDDPA